MEGRLQGKIVVISGPSGVGKDAIIKVIIARSGFRKFAAYTTRPMRDGEIHNLDYRFVSEEQFTRLQNTYEFLDCITVNGFRYGTPLIDFQRAVESGKRFVVALAVKSALLLRERVPNVSVVFVFPPSHKELVHRLQQRGMTQDEIQSRMTEDPVEIALALSCDFIVVNHTDEIEETADRITRFII